MGDKAQNNAGESNKTISQRHVKQGSGKGIEGDDTSQPLGGDWRGMKCPSIGVCPLIPGRGDVAAPVFFELHDFFVKLGEILLIFVDSR